MSSSGSAFSVGPEVIVAFADGVKLNKFSSPGFKIVPCFVVLEWSNLTVIVRFVTGPFVRDTRTGMGSNSCHPMRLPVVQVLVSPKDWPCNCASKQVGQASVKVAWADRPE